MTSPDWARDLNRVPDWEEWRFIPDVQLWQAVALSLNVEPDKLGLRHPDGYQPGVPMFNESSEFDKRLRVLRANFDDRGKFPTKPTHVEPEWCSDIRLDEFAAWVLNVTKWPIPDELAALAKQSISNQSESLAQPASIVSQPNATADSQQIGIITNKLRRNSLDPAIDNAIAKAGSYDLQKVWLAIREAAKDGVLPFTGAVEEDSLFYVDDDNKAALFTKDALGKRLARRKK